MGFSTLEGFFWDFFGMRDARNFALCATLTIQGLAAALGIHGIRQGLGSTCNPQEPRGHHGGNFGVSWAG